MTISTTNLVPVSELKGDSPTDTKMLKGMYSEASRFLTSFKWCGGIRRGWFGQGVGGVVAVFLFEIEPSKPDVDDTLWVVVGDLPPAYLVIDDSPTPKAALATYVAEAKRWVAAVRSQSDLADCIPVNVPPTSENASRLERRLEFLEREFLSDQG
jgi:hypothetical protein